MNNKILNGNNDRVEINNHFKIYQTKLTNRLAQFNKKKIDLKSFFANIFQPITYYMKQFTKNFNPSLKLKECKDL